MVTGIDTAVEYTGGGKNGRGKSKQKLSTVKHTVLELLVFASFTELHVYGSHTVLN